MTDSRARKIRGGVPRVCQGALGKHMNIFIDGEAISDRDRLNDIARPDSESYVMQALSGG